MTDDRRDEPVPEDAPAPDPAPDPAPAPEPTSAPETGPDPQSASADVADPAPEVAPVSEGGPEGAPGPSPAFDRHQAPTAADRDLVVSVLGVSRVFDKRPVVRDIDLTVTRGTILGIIGPSGSGKTTTIRMLTGALRPTSGQIRVLGERPTHFRRSTREQIGYMPQLFTLYPDLNARENVDFVASLFGMLWPRRRRRTKEVLTLLGLWDARGRRASQLSGGMQRRLELASALVHEPVLLILDEPTAGIDPLLRMTIWEELHRLRDAGRTILVTTQYVQEAEECDDVALIAEGRVIARAAPDELRREALGGQQIEVETVKLFDGSVLEQVAGVIAIHQLDARRLRITVDDAAEGLPTVVDSITAAGGEVARAEELRPSFDEVFAALVERAKRDSDAASAAESEAGGTAEDAA